MPSHNRPYSVFTFLKPSPKKVVLLPKIGWVKFFYHLPAHIVEIVSEYIFFDSKKKKSKKRKNTDTQTNKKEKNLKKISWL